MRNSHTLEQVIENAVAVHSLAADLYQQLRHRTTDERVAMLLDDMAAHDLRMKAVLAEMLTRIEQRALDTHMKYTLEEDPQEFLASVAPQGTSLTVQDIGALGQAVHDYLTQLIEHAWNRCAAETCQKWLKDILQLEEAERRNFSRAVLSTQEV